MRNKREDELHITTQFRAGSAMVYDFGCGGETLTLRVFPKSDAADPNEWRVEARTSDTPGALVVCEWGSTRAIALQAVGESWRSRAAVGSLPPFDWGKVAEALTTVRAL